MRFLDDLSLLIVALLIAGCAVGSSPDSTESDDTDQPLEAKLFSLQTKKDGYDINFVEIERGENYSLAKVDIKEGTSVGSTMILMKATCEIARQRDFKYFITTYPDGGESLLKIYFTNDTSMPLTELVGDDYSSEAQEVFDDVGYLPVSMFAPMFDKTQSEIDDVSVPAPQSSERNRVDREDFVQDPAPSSPPGKQPGEIRSFAEMEFAWIPPGVFEMGSALSAEEVHRRYIYPDSDPEWYEDEHPRHTVTISRGFWLGRFEMTNRDYRRFDPEHDSGDRDGFDLDHDDSPVVNISWLDAQRYIEWLNGQKEGIFRLPTEAEWEYACRAGTSSVVYWGDLDEKSGQYANGADETFLTYMPKWITLSTTDGYVVQAPVGSFKPNQWGLYDMIGNVTEYCQDWWGPYTAKTQIDPEGPKSGRFRIVRGGSYGSYPSGYRAAARRYDDFPHEKEINGGFRLVRNQD